MITINKYKIAIIGIGYVGLPLLEALHSNENNIVIGYDISDDKLSNAKRKLRQENINIHLTSCLNDVKDSQYYIVTVPTPINNDNKPDTSCLHSACEEIGNVISNGDTVIFESTVYPGMTEDFCIPIIESTSGLKSQIDFFFGYSPERINVGDKFHTIYNTTKVVAGCDTKTTDKIYNLYKSIKGLKVVKADSVKTAEASKIMENTQRDLLISFANEYSEFCKKIGVDINNVIKCASTKWNFMPVYPGLVGGHCISVDPYYLLDCASKHNIDLEIVRTARKVNEEKPYKVAGRIMDMIYKNDTINRPSNTTILVLGFSYKENSNDIRNTKIANLIAPIKKEGYKIEIFDPIVNDKDVKETYNISLIKRNDITKKKFNVVLLAVHHKIFNKEFIKSIVKKNTMFIDLKEVL